MYKGLTPQDVRLSIHPGDWYFGKEYTSLYTVLGSCVALTAWHPQLKIGGLCHYLLPVIPGSQRATENLLNENAGRYAKTALLLMKESMQRYASLNEYQLGLFGGSDTLSNYGIGKQNIIYAQQWLLAENLAVAKTDVSGLFSRSLVLNMLSGEIEVKSYPIKIGD
jgi:chemotaxis protein CheD